MLSFLEYEPFLIDCEHIQLGRWGILVCFSGMDDPHDYVSISSLIISIIKLRISNEIQKDIATDISFQSAQIIASCSSLGNH